MSRQAEKCPAVPQENCGQKDRSAVLSVFTCDLPLTSIHQRAIEEIAVMALQVPSSGCSSQTSRKLECAGLRIQHSATGAAFLHREL